MNVFFCHLPKCGGLSVKEILKSEYGSNKCYDILDIFVNRKKEDPGVFYGLCVYCVTRTSGSNNIFMEALVARWS